MKKNNGEFITSKTICLVQLLGLKNCPNITEDQISLIDDIMGFVRILKSEEDIIKEKKLNSDKLIEEGSKIIKERNAKNVACVIHSFLHDLNINHTIGQYELNAVIDKWKAVKDNLCKEYNISDNYLSDNLI